MIPVSSTPRPTSAAAFERACRVIPGGVNSPARAFGAVGGQPIFIARYREPMLAGAFLVGLSTFQGEYDFAVPQFRLVFHPMLLMLAAAVGLVAARLRLGRGGALKAVLVYLLIRGTLALIVGVILPHTTPKFPLYLAEALVVEAVAFRFPRGRPIAFGIAAPSFAASADWYQRGSSR